MGKDDCQAVHKLEPKDKCRVFCTTLLKSTNRYYRSRWWDSGNVVIYCELCVLENLSSGKNGFKLDERLSPKSKSKFCVRTGHKSRKVRNCCTVYEAWFCEFTYLLESPLVSLRTCGIFSISFCPVITGLFQTVKGENLSINGLNCY